jgi:4-amino-4-deoxy-L-arabinose transferase-like glycosyltransferase
MERLILAVIMIFAGFLRFANLDRLGYVNHYYTAAMVSMLKSWHNFFFLAAEPGGAVSVDKPPVGLWLQAISVKIFGVNTLGVLLPEILAGLVSILILYHLVKEYFGSTAGTIAAIVLALTPISIATERNNTSDSLLIMTLLFAALAYLKAADTGKTRSLMIGAALVGIGFNIKMLEAFLPLPAFYGVYLLGSHEKVWQKMGKLLASTVVLAVVSLAWVTIVDLTPANQRPFVGSSGDNSEISLITGYNGMSRLLGMGGGNRNSLTGGMTNRGFQNQGSVPGNRPNRNNGNPGITFNQQRGGRVNGGGQIQAGNSGTASGSVSMGQTGIARLFIAPLSKNVSWLLPFGLISLLLLLIGGKVKYPLNADFLAAVLWGGWLITGGVFFSIAQFFHEYYLSILGPPLAALVGIGAIKLWRFREKQNGLGVSILFIAAAGTLVFEGITASSYLNNTIWLPYAWVLFAIGAILCVAFRKQGWLAGTGFACILTALLIAPGIWSVLTNRYPSENQSLPSVYSGQTGSPADLQGVEVNQKLVEYLEARTAENSYLMAVPSSMQGSDYVIATGRPVLYLGGFMGTDQVISTDELARLVQTGTLRYIYWNSNGNGNTNRSDYSSWITAHCQVVSGFDTTTQNSGAPGGTTDTTLNTTGQNGGFGMNFGTIQISIYDCGTAD